MSTPVGLQVLTDFSGGQITETSDSLTPNNVMRLILNMDDDVLGLLRVRKGVTAIGNQVQDGKNCLGVYNFRDSGTGSNNQQIAVFNNSGDTQSITYYNNSGTWTAITSGSSFIASKKFRFATFLDLVFMVNSGFEVKSWTGSSGAGWGTTNLTSAPAGQFITVFNSRLYIASTSANPDRLYFSSIQDGAGAITWDTTNDWIDINPSDGMNITGLANTGSLILIFKERAMYRWNGSSTDANLIVDFGTSSQESIAIRNGRVFFFNPYGVYVTDGGYPTRISKPIHRWIQAISPSYYSNVAGVCDEDNYYCSIGDVTVDDVAYSNVVLCYTFSTQTWRVRSYAEQFRVLANYIDSSGNFKIIGGNDDGDVQDFNLGSTDTGTPISYRVKTKKLDFGSSAYVKKFSDIFTFGNGLVNAKTFITTDDSEPREIRWSLVGWFKRVFGMKNSGRQFTFEIVGNSVDGQGEFEGWELTDVSYDGYNN